ncbi:MAG: hypothetical protein V4574_15825 [Pseudomonadota bacterium]
MIHKLMLAAAAWLALSGAADPEAITTIARVDPLTIEDDDFARHRDPAEWRGLTVERIEFRNERTAWRLWRIADPRRPNGPLWFVPHDNENAGFEAALVELRNHGGTIVAVDSGVAPDHDGQRMNYAVERGRPVDPNRNFDSALPGYAKRVLAPLARGAWPIIALHSNTKGFNTAESACNKSDPPGNGVISIRFCDQVYAPHPSQSRAFPFDDDDTVAFATWRTGGKPGDSFCGDTLAAADFNVVFERVVVTDRSLSNYAVLHGLAYLNFETLDQGVEPGPLADSRNRLVAMIDRAMALCGSKR